MDESLARNTLEYLDSIKPIELTCPPAKASLNAGAAVALPGLDWAEFGVWQGVSSRILLQLLPDDLNLHLFDSFEGLPESWGNFREKGRFALTEDQIPKFDDSRVVMHRGLFEETLPPFCEMHPNPLGLVHIDCDIYSSTKCILTAIDPLLVAGSVLVFDEYYNYEAWRDHEYKAFVEYVEEFDRRFEYVARTQHEQVVVILTH